jgi:phage tail-like protein
MPNTTQNQTSLTIAHVADHNRRYPGESVTFYTRLEAHQSLSDVALRVTLPPELLVESYRAMSPVSSNGHITLILPEIEIGAGGTELLWHVGQSVPTGSRYEYTVQARVAHVEYETFLESEAVATATTAGNETAAADECLALAVATRGNYLQYLPGIYEDDDLMSRFLMFFESFWAPIEGQLEILPLYFDPRMTTPDFLPWLASWIDLTLDEQWSEDKRRRLLQSAATLYRKRGTKRGLQEYLEIYTGQQAHIIERRAENFRLGPKARLGPGVALGSDNLPHTFIVSLRLPPIVSGAGPEEDARQEQVRRRTIEAIIEASKPAHTGYTLRLETI